MNVVTEKKPYVKLFKTPNGYYCFDVNRSEMVELEKDTFEYLQQSFSGEEDMKEPSTEWENMRSEGYFSEESNVKQVKHVLTDYVDDFLKRRITKLTLQVTQDCNFRCKYCIYSEEKIEDSEHIQLRI